MSRVSLCDLLSGKGSWALTDPEWEIALAQARRANLVARLALVVTRAQAQVPASVGRHLESALKVQQRAAEAMRLETRRIVDLLHLAGIRSVLLKGAAYLAAGLPQARGRLFGDIDVMVARADLARAESALLGGGWLANDLSPYSQRYYREWTHEIPPLAHVRRGSIVDLHHTIVPPTSAFRVDGGLLMDAARTVDPVPGMAVLQPTDMVLHAAVHLFTDGEFENGLRDLFDLRDMLEHFGTVSPDFWTALFDRADRLGLQRPLYHALRHVERLFGPAVPVAMGSRYAALRPPVIPRLVMARLLDVALRPNHPSCTAFGHGFARWLLYVRSHWLRMPLRLLVPHLIRKAWMRRFPERLVPVVDGVRKH